VSGTCVGIRSISHINPLSQGFELLIGLFWGRIRAFATLPRKGKLVMPSKDVKVPLERLAGNFRWIWDTATQDLFSTVDPEVWRRTRDPHQVLRSVPAKQLKQLAADTGFQQRLKAAEQDLKEYLGSKPKQPQVAYFCMEHGIAPALRTYAGGLGMLAGCIEKTASDLGTSMVAVGLRYQWRFRQQLSYGWQSEEWLPGDPAHAGREACPEATVHGDQAGERVAGRVWR
jgi:glucan phosphorylase